LIYLRIVSFVKLKKVSLSISIYKIEPPSPSMIEYIMSKKWEGSIVGELGGNLDLMVRFWILWRLFVWTIFGLSKLRVSNLSRTFLFLLKAIKLPNFPIDPEKFDLFPS